MGLWRYERAVEDAVPPIPPNERRNILEFGKIAFGTIPPLVWHRRPATIIQVFERLPQTPGLVSAGASFLSSGQQ